VSHAHCAASSKQSRGTGCPGSAHGERKLQKCGARLMACVSPPPSQTGVASRALVCAAKACPPGIRLPGWICMSSWRGQVAGIKRRPCTAHDQLGAMLSCACNHPAHAVLVQSKRCLVPGYVQQYFLLGLCTSRAKHEQQLGMPHGSVAQHTTRARTPAPQAWRGGTSWASASGTAAGAAAGLASRAALPPPAGAPAGAAAG